MRVIADIGFVGFPNAGKSTLLRALSRARPKAAAYPFTTLRPHVGVVQFTDGAQLAVADTPGLIEGAYRGRGLGAQFLRHVRRCTCLAYVVDACAGEEPAVRLQQLRHELEQYEPGLSQRPHLIVVNKIDLDGASQGLDDLRRALNESGSGEEGGAPRVKAEVVSVAGLHGTNIGFLADRMRALWERYSKVSEEESSLWRTVTPERKDEMEREADG